MTIRCEIVSQDRTVFEGDVDIVVLPGTAGEMGILPHHAPVLTTLKYGVVKVRYGGKEDIFAVSGGVAAIGLVHGRPNPPAGNRERAYEVSRDFVCQFRTAFGVTVCGELIRDLLREGTAEAEKRRKARCYQYTLTAVQLCIDTLIRFERAPSPATLLK